MKRIDTLSIIVIFSLACAAAFGAAEPPKMKAILTVPHEFDMLVKSGHIQGLACSEKGIYLSHQTGLAKIDWESAGIGLAYWEYLLPKRLLGR